MLIVSYSVVTIIVKPRLTFNWTNKSRMITL